MYLNHDHRESKDVRSLAICPLSVQDLWRGPSRGVTKFIQVALHGILIFNNCSMAKIRDACMTGVVHKDVRLAGCQYGGEIRFRLTTHSLDTPMNHITGVDVVEALCNLRQLVMGVSVG